MFFKRADEKKFYSCIVVVNFVSSEKHVFETFRELASNQALEIRVMSQTPNASTIIKIRVN